MIEQSTIKKYFPLEITTHNIYFHENSPILSCDGIKNYLATSGYDKVIRIWKFIKNNKKYEENVYKLSGESSIKLELFKELEGMKYAINCIRFKKNSEFCLAACSDRGRVIIYDNDRIIIVRKEDGDDAYDLTWGDENLFIGFVSGKVEVYNFKENKNVEFIVSKIIHKETIQGISYLSKFNLIATHSLDKTVKIHLFENYKLSDISTFSNKIDNSCSLFKRLDFIDDELCIFIKNNFIEVYSYPFQEIHLRKKFGPLNSSVIKVMKYKSDFFIFTKKSVYIFENDILISTIDNITFKPVTDAFIIDDIVFISSMDGFIATINLNCSN